MLREHPAMEQARQAAARWARDAVEGLNPLPAGPVKDALSAFAGAVVARTG